MKRLIAVAVCCLLALGTYAAGSFDYANDGNSGWLYWTIDLADDWGNAGSFVSPPTAIGTFDAWLVAKSDDGTWYFHDDANPETIVLDGSGCVGDIAGASIANLDLLSGALADYVFFSQIGAYDDHSAIWTSQARDYASLCDFIQESEISPGDVWNTAVGSPVVPEPTSAMLMLFALAGLALRRQHA